MSVKLKAGSMELEAAFIEWLRTQGYNPSDGIDPFFSGSEFVRSQLPLIHESEKAQLFAEARRHLERRSRDPAFAGQFAEVHDFTDREGRALRYAVLMTLSDSGAEWIGRVWDRGGYIGEISGSESGRHASYVELARRQIEAQLDDRAWAGRLDQRM